MNKTSIEWNAEISFDADELLTMVEIPKFESEDAERDFWAKHDSTDFLEGAEEIASHTILLLKFPRTHKSAKSQVVTKGKTGPERRREKGNERSRKRNKNKP